MRRRNPCPGAGTLERSVTVDAADDEDHRLHLVELIMGGSPEPALHV